ncbi:MAG: ABC transporter substrate-binding protein, partial [Candidatus Sericytochromatia bacterium]
MATLLLAGCEPPEEGTGYATGSSRIASESDTPPSPAKQLYQLKAFEIGRPGGSRTIAVASLPNSFNPYLGSEQSSLAVLTQLFVGLVRIDALHGKMEPALAESLNPNADKTVWTIRLRPNLKWSDGKPLTAEDVVFTYKAIIDNPNIPNNYRDFWAYQGQFPKVSALDARTVRFTLTQPFAPFENNLVAPILPRHVFAAAVRPDAQNNVRFNQMWGLDAKLGEIVSNGPWKLVNYVPGARVELVPNPHYFERDTKGQRLPYLDKLIFLEAADANVALIKFQRGETDAYALRPEDYDLLAPRQKSEGFTIHNLGPSPSQLFVSFNQSTARRADGKPLVDPLRSAWFRNRAFRQALALSIDKQALIQSVYQGRATSQFSHLSPRNPFFATRLTDYGHDPAQARRLLERAGFHQNDAGQLRDPTGHAVGFELSTNTGSPQRDAICAQLRRAWGALGIRVDYRPRPFNLISRQLHESHDWEALVLGLAGSAIEPHFSSSRWMRSGRMHLFNMGSGPEWQGKATDFAPWEKQMEALYAQAAVTPAADARRVLYTHAQLLERAELPFIYLVSELSLLAVRDSLGNARPSIYGGSGLLQLNWNSQY